MPNEKRRSKAKTLAIALSSLIMIGLVGGLAWYFWPTSSAAMDTNWAILPVQQQVMVAQVTASGVVAPEQQATLRFATGGTVTAVLVAVGDDVEADQVLARLRDDDLALELTRAQANLDQAIASRERTQSGATPAEIAAAEAQIAAAQGSLQQTLGNVTQADLDAARAQVTQAQAALDKLNSGPRSTDVSAAQAQLDSANASLASAQAQRDAANSSLEQSRTTLSASKTQAEAAVGQAANVVRDRQAEYARIRDENQKTRDVGFDVPQEALDAEASAERAIATAESQRDNAQVAYDAAVQNEITGLEQGQAQVDQTQAGIDQAQASVDQAQANLAKLTSPAEADQLAQAQANLASAKANLTRLTGSNRSGGIAAAQGNVAQSQANLERILEAKNPSDLAVAEAQVKSAEASRDLAQLQLIRSELRAPFAGTVAAVQLNVGENASSDAVTLADVKKLHLNATVDEIDVAQIAISQPVSITLDALPSLGLRGVVRSISPLALEQTGATSYQVRIDVLDPAPGVRPGMSATAEIEVDRKPAALVIPRRALQQDGQRTSVLVVAGEPTEPGARPPTRYVEVTTGLTNEQTIEILSGLQVGDQVLVEGVNANYFQQFGPGGR